MISVDATRCGYFAACVGVCPLGALGLCKTRLVVSQECIECNLCLPARLSYRRTGGGRDQARLLPALKQRHDAVVVGAGPAGSVAAWEAAVQGLSVLPPEGQISL